MITHHRVAMSFAKLADTRIDLFANSVILNLTGNPAYPNLPVSLADLQSTTDAYASALADAQFGGRIATAIKKEARGRLVARLRDTAHYVQIIAKNDLATLLSSGFTAIDRNTAQTPVDRPVMLKASNQHSTQLWLRARGVANARSYQLRFKAGDGEWQDGGYFSQARRIVVTGLTPGTVYTVQLRAIGGSTGASDWSNELAIMAT